MRLLQIALMAGGSPHGWWQPSWLAAALDYLALLSILNPTAAPAPMSTDLVVNEQSNSSSAVKSSDHESRVMSQTMRS